MSKKRVLFVDDEPNVLQGLSRMLRSMRNDWEMDFASNGPEALSKLKQGDFHVVVSDMRMPIMDGADLLNKIREQYPDVVRIILSGHSDQKMIFKSIGSTHQYMSKPCDADKIKNTITHALALREILNNQKIQKLVSKLKSIPSVPSLYTEIMAELQAPDPKLSRVGEIISKDVGMTAKILQLVNSAFFGLQVHIESPVQAAKLLGLEIITALVLTFNVFSKYEKNKVIGLSPLELSRHSFAVGTYAKHIAREENIPRKVVDDIFIAGLLHDVGKLILADNLPDDYNKAFELAVKNKISLYQAEKEIFEVTHASVGAYLLGLWGLPDPILEAVAFHHEPADCLNKGICPLLLIYLANIFAR